MGFMNIDWKKAESKPNSKQKVLGRILIDWKEKINDLEKQLALKLKELDEAKHLLNGLTSNDTEHKFKILNAERKISTLEDKLKTSTEKIEELKKTIEHRNEVIDKLENGFEQRITQIERLKEENELLNEQLKQVKVAPKLISKLQNIMLHKGFVGDKEFNYIMQKYGLTHQSVNF
jgi:chromosome segregation ATPase